jgi:hypothetical protein
MAWMAGLRDSPERPWERVGIPSYGPRNGQGKVSRVSVVIITNEFAPVRFPL